MPHLLGARWRLDLEELSDLDAPELVNVAQADAVRSCRVAELVRVNGDTKQNGDEEPKTHCLLVAMNKRRKKQKSPQGGKFKATNLCSMSFAS